MPYSFSIGIMILFEFMSEEKTKQCSGETENEQHERGSGSFAAPEKRPEQRDIPFHNRFTDFVYHKASEEKTDGDREELQRIAAGVDSSDHSGWDRRPHDDVLVGAHHRDEDPSQDLADAPEQRYPGEGQQKVFRRHGKEHAQINDFDTVFGLWHERCDQTAEHHRNA